MHSSFGLTEKQQALRLAQQGRKLAWERKRREEEELNKLVIIPQKTLTEKQLAWIRTNCQPKVRKMIYRLPKFSRWAKRGPMGRSDWMKFLKWADLNAEPKKQPKPHCKPEEPKKPTKPPLKITQEELWEDIDKLATPRKPRNKYIYPPPINYPYSPKIRANKPPRHDKGRPFAPPKVPVDFQHIDLETDFWSKLRFPVRPSALKFKASDSLLDLAQPRVTPPKDPHCPIPPQLVEYVQPRIVMNREQWRSHKIRLRHLAAPVQRNMIY